MIVLLDTSTPICKLSFIENETTIEEAWQADRELAKGILKYMSDQLQAHQYSWSDISGIGIFEGPGSFTGLRIGITVANTIADSQSIPIVGARGENWQAEARQLLSDGNDEHIVMPFYGSDAHITSPRK